MNDFSRFMYADSSSITTLSCQPDHKYEGFSDNDMLSSLSTSLGVLMLSELYLLDCI